MHRSRHSRDENLYTRVGPIGPYHKKWRAVGTSANALACALASKPQLLPSFTDTSTRAVASTFKSSPSARAVACTVKKNKIRCFSCVTVSLIVGVTVEKRRSALGVRHWNCKKPVHQEHLTKTTLQHGSARTTMRGRGFNATSLEVRVTTTRGIQRSAVTSRTRKDWKFYLDEQTPQQ